MKGPGRAVAALACLAMSCAMIQKNLPLCAPQTPAGPCLSRVELDIPVSDSFTDAELGELQAGAGMWEAGSAGMVQIDVRRRYAGEPPIVYRATAKALGGFLGVTVKRRGFDSITVAPDEIVPSVGLAGVFAHGLGHFMGLRHSADPGALMAPTVHDCVRVTPGDLDALQEAL